MAPTRLDIRQVQKILNRGQKACWAKLETLADKSDDERMEKLRDTLLDILDTMAQYLFVVSRVPEMHRETGGPTPVGSADFYFWPGYDSIILPERRVMHLKDWGPARIAVGMGFDLTGFDLASSVKRLEAGTQNDLSLPGCALAALVFDQVLNSASASDLLDGQPFTPGGTHGWAASGDVVLPDDSGLEVLTISYDHGSANMRQGMVEITLPASSPETWGFSVSNAITSLRGPRWPYVPLDAPDATIQDQRFQSAREILYNIWLLSVFGEAWSSHNSRVFAHAIHRLTDLRLSNLPEQLPKFLASDLRLTPDLFKFWYTLALPRGLDLPQLKRQGIEPELGSAMFLTTYQLSDDFLALASQWVQGIYLGMRQFELADPLATYGEERQASVFAHQTVHLVEIPWQDPSRQLLNPYSQFSLWTLRALLKHIWGGISLNPLKPIHKATTEDDTTSFPTWSDLSNYQVLSEVAYVAILQGIFRSLRAPEEHLSSQFAEMKQKARFAVRDRRKSFRTTYGTGEADEYLVRHYLTVLKWKVELSGICEVPTWATSEGFLFAFHHALWQAAHHAVVAYESSNPSEVQDRHYLYAEISESECRIVNRSAYPIQAIGFVPRAKDRRFYELLKRKLCVSYQGSLRPTFAIEAPKPLMADEEYWETKILLLHRT